MYPLRGVGTCSDAAPGASCACECGPYSYTDHVHGCSIQALDSGICVLSRCLCCHQNYAEAYAHLCAATQPHQFLVRASCGQHTQLTPKGPSTNPTASSTPDRWMACPMYLRAGSVQAADVAACCTLVSAAVPCVRGWSAAWRGGAPVCALRGHSPLRTIHWPLQRAEGCLPWCLLGCVVAAARLLHLSVVARQIYCGAAEPPAAVYPGPAAHTQHCYMP